jgi:hypothetical protein
MDTIVVPAQQDGFEKVYLGESSLHAIRIAGGMLPKTRYIAAYRTRPAFFVRGRRGTTESCFAEY